MHAPRQVRGQGSNRRRGAGARPTAAAWSHCEPTATPSRGLWQGDQRGRRR